MSKELIRLRNLVMEFDGERILDNINLYINDHEFLTLLGPSGCGKTTTLRIIGGFLTPTSGDVLFDGARMNDVPAYKRQINTVFQRYALFPHLDVYDNIAFGLRIAKQSKDEIDRRVTEMLEVVSLKGYETRKITSLSGGQRRVAIARALVNRPKVPLLDEPLGALDLRLRKDMQNELKRIQQAMGITFIYVTHDQEEALAMSDTIVVMDKGRIQQIGRPEDIYNEPKNAFVADFIGESNILDGVMLDDCLVKFFGRTFTCVDKGFNKNEPVDVVIRPEDIDIVAPDGGHLTGTVTSVTFKGLNYDIIVDFKGFKWLIQTTDYQPVGGRHWHPPEPGGHPCHAQERILRPVRRLQLLLRRIRRTDGGRRRCRRITPGPGSGPVALSPNCPLYHLDDCVHPDSPGRCGFLRPDRSCNRALSLGNLSKIFTGAFPRIFLRSVWYSLVASHLPGHWLPCGLLHRPAASWCSAVFILAGDAAHVHELPAPDLGMGGPSPGHRYHQPVSGPLWHRSPAPHPHHRAVILGMVYNYLPYMILPLYTIIMKIDPLLIEAAEDLGCGGRHVFSRVILPLSMPGIISGVTMVFVPAVSTFYISQKLGSTGTTMIGDVIESQFKSANNPNLGAALSLVLMLLIFLCVWLMNRFAGSDNEGRVMV